jgi:hypothetical protein
VRKIIEHVFDMLKTRFHILSLPMLIKSMTDVQDMVMMVHVFCVFHNICLELSTVGHITEM